MLNFFQRNPQRIVKKITYGKKKISLILYFDSLGNEYYNRASSKQKKDILKAYSKLEKLIRLVFEENSELIDSSKTKIEIKVTRFKCAENVARTEIEKCNYMGMYFEVGVIFLEKHLLNDEYNLKSYFSSVINHELTHGHDYKMQKNNLDFQEIFEKYKNVNLLPYNLILTLRFMRNEGLARWVGNFYNLNEEFCYLNHFEKFKKPYKKKLYSILKSDKQYSAYNLVGFLPYELGFHMFLIITLSYLKKRNLLNSFSIINKNHNKIDFNLYYDYEKDNDLWLYPLPKKNILRQFYTAFRLLDEFQLLEKYLKAFKELGFKEENLIFSKEEIKVIRSLKQKK